MRRAETVVVNTSQSPHATLSPVPIGAVRFEDTFWAPRLEQMRTVTLPSQYEILEETGRIDNFRRVAGTIDKPFQGIYYNDSDVYKWIEGCAYSLAYEHDEQVEALANRVIDAIADAQGEDGYLNTYFSLERADERWSNLRDMHELYCAGHLFHAAVAYHRATGDAKLLDVAVRFADCIDATFGPDKKDGTPGHPQIEMGLVELYRETGEERYLRLSEFFLDRRGHGVIGGSPYHQDHAPFRELSEVVGHAVRALYLNAGATDLFTETGESSLIDALDRMWRNMVERRMYVTGGVGARHSGEAFGGDYELPNEVAYAETCGAIANAIWNWRMLLATGEERFADVMELAIYNGALSGIALDGRHYFYVNPLANRGTHLRQRWFDCACCPTNIIRLIGEIPGLLYSTSDEGIWVHLYARSTAEIALDGTTVRLSQRTDYPWDGEIEIRVDPPNEAVFTLRLRIPGWSETASVSVNGETVSSAASGGYHALRRTWRPGDRVTLSFPMEPRFFVAHPLVEPNWGKVALKRGPIVFCLEGVDQDGADPWCAEVDPSAAPEVRFEPDLLNGVAVARIEGDKTELDAWGERLYMTTEEEAGRRSSTKWTAIPYYAWSNRGASPMNVWMRRRIGSGR